jgi:hypothetical protein
MIKPLKRSMNIFNWYNDVRDIFESRNITWVTRDYKGIYFI